MVAGELGHWLMGFRNNVDDVSQAKASYFGQLISFSPSFDLPYL